MDSRLTAGVGKKIVDALKHQSDVGITPFSEEGLSREFQTPDPEVSVQSSLNMGSAQLNTSSFSEIPTPQITSQQQISTPDMNNTIDNAFNDSLMNFRGVNSEVSNLSAVEDMELPTNVNVLRQLVTKLPSGVSKQTGALIIKQTMEALGISMTNVLQEAQQVQEKLTQSVRECQTNVLEYKKQINLLEVQARKYQRQFAAINDIISLFIQTGN